MTKPDWKKQPENQPVKTLVIKKTDKMIKDGHGDINAIVLESDYKACVDHSWNLVYRWGKARRKLAAETYINGVKIQLHRFVMFLTAPHPGEFVIPKDNDALNCVPSNLEIMTKEQAFNRPDKPRRSNGKLSDDDQKWLDDECVKAKQSRWEFIGGLIQAERERREFE